MVVPDPRVFALHKLWLSQQPGREPVKKQHDRNQAQVVAELVRAHMPQLPWDEEAAFQRFPAEVRALLPELQNSRSGIGTVVPSP